MFKRFVFVSLYDVLSSLKRHGFCFWTNYFYTSIPLKLQHNIILLYIYIYAPLNIHAHTCCSLRV